jgi:hypothetical protein
MVFLFGVVPAQCGDFLEESKEFIEHIDAKAESFEVEVIFRILSHLHFAIIVVIGT